MRSLAVFLIVKAERQRTRRSLYFQLPKDNKKKKSVPHSGNMEQTGMPTEISRVCSKHFTEGWHSDNVEDEYYQSLIFNTKSKSDADMFRRRGNNKEILLTVSCILFIY